MTKIHPRLADKLSRIRAGAYKPEDFIIADAKDADMGGGIGALGFATGDDGVSRAKTALDYRSAIKAMIASGLPDIMLTSLSTAEALAADNALSNSEITAAVRLNDTTDIWGLRGAKYQTLPAMPFRTAKVEQALSYCVLGLYAVTFYNDRDQDVAALEAYARFRDEAVDKGMLHFLEVFNPAFDIDCGANGLGHYVNDCIVRCLAGVASTDRPLFLKMQYNGARAMEELASHDPANLIVGILGGAAGTTRDTFELVSQAERFGGRVALFGRKVYLAEDSIEMVRLMRAVVKKELATGEAVRVYHDHLMRNGIASVRSVEDDGLVTDPVLKPEAQ